MPATPLSLLAPSHAAATAAVSTIEQSSDVTNGNTISNDGNVALLVRNTNAATRNLTVNYKNTYDGQTIPPISYTIPVTPAQVIIVLGNPGLFGDITSITYSNGAGGDLKIVPFATGG